MATGAETLVRSLEAHGVGPVFGVCGDTSVGFYRALAEMDHDLEHVLVRDERSASFAADAYARLSGRPGVCEGPSGGGATYLLPGLAEADDSNVPVVGINTTVPVRYRGRGVLTELDQPGLFETVTTWNASVDHPDLVARMVRQAFARATAGAPGATHLSFPMDALDGDTDEPAYADDATTTYPAHRPTPDPGRIERAAELLAGSECPVAVAGGGVYSSGASEALRELAERVGMPVATTLTGAGCIGDSPLSIGVVGENGSREYANEMVREADALLLLGTAVESVWTSKWSDPPDGEKRVVRVDVDAGAIGRNYRTEVALPGDLRETLRELGDAVGADEAWDPAEIRRRHAEWVAPYEAAFDSGEFPIRPERMVAGAARVLDDDAVIVSDPGTSCPYFAALYPFETVGRNWITPRAHGALGYTIPGLVGAHYARPDATLVGFTGDGSVGTSAGDLETLARLDLPVTVVVVNNGSFSWIEAGQRNAGEFSFGVEFDGVDYAGLAGNFGLSGFRVESADADEGTLREAVETEGPALVDLPTRPIASIENVPVDWLEPGE